VTTALTPGLDPGLAAMLELIERLGLPRMGEGTPAEARAAFRRVTCDIRAPEVVVPVGSVEDGELPGPAGPLRTRTYRPAGAAGAVPTVLFLHGGGWVIGDLDTHDNQARRLCRDIGAVVVSLDYRKAPEAPFPEPVHDAWAGLRWVAEHVAELGGDAGRLAICGDSAGGNLAAAVARRARDAGGPALAAQLLLYPGLDVAAEAVTYPSRVENREGYLLGLRDMEWFGAHYVGAWAAGGNALTDPDLSPLHAADLRGLAPAVVVVAEFDPLRDEGVAYVEALTAAGTPAILVRAAGMIHGFFDLALVSDAVESAVARSTAAFGNALRTP
jgi:acetyl esterase